MVDRAHIVCQQWIELEGQNFASVRRWYRFVTKRDLIVVLLDCEGEHLEGVAGHALVLKHVVEVVIEASLHEEFTSIRLLEYPLQFRVSLQKVDRLLRLKQQAFIGAIAVMFVAIMAFNPAHLFLLGICELIKKSLDLLLIRRFEGVRDIGLLEATIDCEILILLLPPVLERVLVRERAKE